MTIEEFKDVLEEKKVRNYRINGFSLLPANYSAAILKGKIPLSLARKICEGIDNSKLQIRVQGGSYTWSPDDYATNAELADIIDDMISSNRFDTDNYDRVRKNYIRHLEETNRLDDVYITMYYINTVEGLRHVIDCIDESNYENECLLN